MAAKKKSSTKVLPQIKILSIKDVTSAEVAVEVPDEVFDIIVGHGRAVITEKQYFEIGFCAMLKETLEAQKVRSPRKTLKRKHDTTHNSPRSPK